MADHRADRKAFVRQALAAIGIEKPEPDRARLAWFKVQPGDPNVPPRPHLLIHAIAQRIRWRAEYDAALLTATGPPDPDVSATQPNSGLTGEKAMGDNKNARLMTVQVACSPPLPVPMNGSTGDRRQQRPGNLRGEQRPRF